MIDPEIVISASWISQKDLVIGSSASGAETRSSIKGKKVFTDYHKIAVITDEFFKLRKV